jgi:hypothetical protein
MLTIEMKIVQIATRTTRVRSDMRPPESGITSF